VLVIIEHASRRILHVNVTAHPTAQWTLQQLRAAIPSDHTYCFLIHDRDSIFSKQLDRRVRSLGLQALKTPPQAPQTNAICERVLGTLRREALDFLIPLTENHLRRVVMEWAHFYNEGYPHMSLGPGIPQPSLLLPVPRQAHRHPLAARLHVVSRPILGGLHHGYRLEEKAA
jgi:putative transposase